MKAIKIRYNTICDDDRLFWRVIIDYEEYFASEVNIEVPAFTTKDYVFDSKIQDMAFKHHITCYSNNIIWDGDILTIK
jgi:hypothetical protein